MLTANGSRIAARFVNVLVMHLVYKVFRQNLSLMFNLMSFFRNTVLMFMYCGLFVQVASDDGGELE